VKVRPRPLTGVLCLLAYLAAFYGVWIVNDVDYGAIGDSADTLLKWYVMPLVAGAIVLVIAATVLGWWRPALVEPAEARLPRWVLVPGLLMAVLAVAALLSKDYSSTTATMLVWLVLGSVGVGFGEEMANRGLLLTGLRGALTEPWVWFFSCLCFGLMHLPNWAFGEGPIAAGQVFLAFLAGSTLYLLRRGTGLLIWAMALHGFWDFSTFIGEGGDWVALVNPALGVVALVMVFVVLRRERGVRHVPGAASRLVAG
jgi:membrane protease YdiL (CAAX protease family)